MNKELCLIHANCQGDPLVAALRLHPDFSARYEVKLYVNYAHEVIPENELTGCSLFLYQWLDPKWENLASEVLLRGIPAGARALCIPNLFFNAYWPFCRSGLFEFEDIFLEELLARGLGKKEILHLYLNTDIRKYYNLDELIGQSRERQRNSERLRWDVPVLDFILERYQEEKVFNSVNHPNKEVCLHVADGLLDLLGFDPLPEELAALYPEPFSEYEAPIHPQVVDYMRLGFVQPGQKYFVYGQEKTFEEYAACYVDFRMLGLDDFIGFMRLDCGRSETPWQPEE
jgi:hypothetical protein